MATLEPKLTFPLKASFFSPGNCSGCQPTDYHPIQSLAVEEGLGLFFEIPKFWPIVVCLKFKRHLTKC